MEVDKREAVMWVDEWEVGIGGRSRYWRRGSRQKQPEQVLEEEVGGRSAGASS